jgi:hypothetical protein
MSPCLSVERLKLDPHLHELLTVFRSHVDEFAFVDPSRVMFVAGAARLRSKASIRPLTFGARQLSADARYSKPLIRRGGVAMLYEICLRPAFFLRANARERLELIIHELLHVSPEFDGTLDRNRRHSRMPANEFTELAEPIAAEVTRSAPRTIEFLSHRGEARLAAWLHRPPSLILESERPSRTVREYDENDLYEAIVEMP